MTFSFVIIIGFCGCKKDDLSSASNSDYLELSTYELTLMSENDMNIIGLAIQRLDISSKDGLYCIKQTSGRQVNISDELFNFIKSGYDHTNATLRSKSCGIRIVK